MQHKEQQQNEILLSLSNEIARMRSKEDLSHLIRTTLKQHLNFDDSFIIRYNGETENGRSYILPPEKGKPENAEFTHQLGRKEFASIKLSEGNKTFALLVLLSNKNKPFTSEALELLKKATLQLSLAIANILAREESAKREEENAALISLSNELASLNNREDLFQVVNTKIKKLLSVEEFAIAKIDEGGETYSAFILDFSEKTRSLQEFNATTSGSYPVTDPIFSKIIHAESPVLFDVKEVTRQPGMPAYVRFWKAARFKYYVTAPLRVGGVNIGCLNFDCGDKEVIHTKHTLIKGICAQLAVAVSNILANEKIRAREEEKNLLLSLSNDIGALRSRNDLFNIFNTKLKELFSINEFGIAQINEDRRTYSAFVLDLEYQSKNLPDFLEITTGRYHVSDPVFSKIMNAKGPVLFQVNELAEESGIPAYVGFWKRAGYQQVLCIPLRVGGTMIGSVHFHIDTHPAININSILLKGVCAQLAVAVSNILANEEISKREEEKTVLLSLSNEIASLNSREDLFQVVNTKIKKLLSVEEFGIAQIDDGGDTYSAFVLEFTDERRRSPNFQQATSGKYSTKDPIFRKVMNSKDPVFFDVEEVAGQPGMPGYVKLWKEAGFKHYLTVPLRVGGDNIGFINFHCDHKAAINTKSILLKGVCAQLAVAVSNIRANEKIREREAEKTQLLEFSNEMASVRDKHVLAKILKRQLKKLFGVEDYVIHALSKDKKTHRPILFDPQADFAQHPDFQKLVHTDTDINDGVFNKILASHDLVTFNIEDWLNSPTPPTYTNAAKDIHLTSMAGIAIRVGQEDIAVMNFRTDGINAVAIQQPIFKSICSQIAIAISNIIANEKVNQQLVEIQQYRQQLEEEKIYLKEEIETTHNYTEIIGESPEIKKVFRLVSQVAASDSTVLLLGETGTGKELIARAVHDASPRKNKLMIKINCAALPPSLVESELFGHERGSFTGAFDRRIGKFELANHSTLFLDEIGEMPLELQVKLLRALQEKEIERLGGKTIIKTDVRIIAATNRDLEKLMDEGKFRSDLYYRLNIFPIQLPPLRERREDIPVLAAHFILRFSKKAGKEITTLSNKVLQELKNYHWPGNIRELEHIIERSVLLATGDAIKEIHLPPQKPKSVAKAEPEGFTIQTIFENEKEYILKILKQVKGRISGEGGAAELLGIPPSTLTSRMKKLGISKGHHG